MSKEIKITPPEGYEIDRENSTFDKIVFKESKKILNYEDIAEKLFYGKKAYYPNDRGSIDSSLINYSTEDCNNSTTKEQWESLLALNKLCNVAKYLNDGWLPDWNEEYERKWFIYVYDNMLTLSNNFVAIYSTPFFKTQELAKQAIEILGEEEIKKALTLNH